MDHNSTEIKEILNTVSPVLKTLLEVYVTPLLSKLNKRKGKNETPTEEHFYNYFLRTYEKVSTISTLVFGNTPKLLRDIYVPLTISFSEERNEKNKSFYIDSFPNNLIDNYPKILITDSAGMGKSTLLKFIFLSIVDDIKGMPILIELRRLNKNKTIFELLQEQINSIDKEIDKQAILEVFRQGGFIFLLDGFDEISLQDREQVTKDIQLFIEKAGKNKFILTSRPESALKSFGDFQEFRISPLKRGEAFELLKKYDKQGVISKLLINRLQESNLEGISEFLTNPLLVSLLYTAFQYKKRIPFKKHIFYRQVYDANFDTHDLTKGDSYVHDKYTQLETDDFHRMLRHIGYSCFKYNRQIEFSKDEVLQLIKEAKKFCFDLQFSESDFLKDLLSNVPLFTQDGIYYRWSHKSLQEYFAAQFIHQDTKEKQSSVLRQIYKSKNLEHYINLLDIYHDIDIKAFRDVILFEFLNDFRNYCNTYYQKISSEISLEDIVYRKELSFNCKLSIHKTQAKTKEKLHEEIGNIFKKQEKSNNYNEIYVLELSKSHLMVFYEKISFEFFALIGRKYPDLMLKNQSVRLKEFSLVKKIFGSNMNIMKESIVHTDDDPNSTFNNPKNFRFTSDLINKARMFPYRLNIIQVENKLIEIEQSLNSGNDENSIMFNF